MCTYNGAAFIEEQLNSILNQSYSINEIVIVDDGSEDQTIAILQRKVHYNPEIKIFSEPNQVRRHKKF